jgi:tripartite-type tricarboxylate transporter receptor subunit TctC
MGTRQRAQVGLAVVAALVIGCFGGPVHAQDGAAYYKGKTVRIVVGFGVGGGYDLYARMMASHLAEAMGATVIVENQPGAGGANALNKLYVTGPDGLHMMIVNGAAAGMAQLIEQAGVRYDLARVGHLGTVSASPWVWISRRSTDPKPAGLIRSQELIRWGGTGAIDGSSDGSAVICEALKLNCKIIKAYKSSNDIALAIERGEMDALYITDLSARAYAANGQAQAVATVAHERSRFFPDLPTIFEALTLDQEQKSWLDLRATVESLGRILVTAPDLPAERLAYLQSVVAQVLTKPQLIAEGEKAQRYIGFVDAPTTRKRAISVVGSQSEDRKNSIREVVLKKFM